MNIVDMLGSRIIPDLKSHDRLGVFKELAKTFLDTGVITDLDGFLADIEAREKQITTSLGDGISIPHAKSSRVKTAAIAFGKSAEGVDCNAPDGSVSKIFFMIAAPQNSTNEHIDTLAALSRLLVDENFKSRLLQVQTAQDVIFLIKNAENNAEANESAKSTVDKSKVQEQSKIFIVAVTACPTGIAHTYMAEESLKKAAHKLNTEIKVETNGTDGVKNQLTDLDIQKAAGVIVAVDRGVETSRFSGKKVLFTDTKEAINNGESLIKTVVSGNIPVFGGGKSSDELVQKQDDGKPNLYKHLLTGVSFMLPFVVSGGILIALAFLFDRLAGVQGGAALGSTTHLASLFMQIGGAAFGLFVPVLGAYIAYSIADRSALTAGFVGGALAVSGGSGFLGAIVAGLLAGYATLIIVKALAGIPKSLHGVRGILLYPIITVFITGILMIIILNPVVKYINEALINWLQNMGGTSRIILGVILGGMMAVDMGGPVNKAAYVFGTGTLVAATSQYGTTVMAAVMAGGMVPPLGIAIATTLFKSKFTLAEREAGKTNYIMGLSFITEGAIPFAAGDPIRVLPSLIVGSAVAGGLSMFFNVAIPAPHGGIVVVFLANHVLLYIVSILAGSFVTAFILSAFKKSPSV